MIEGKFKLLMNIEQYMQSSYWRCSLFRLTYHFKVKYELLLLIINLLETLPTTSCSRFVLKVPGLDSIPNCWSRWNWSSQQCEGWGATVPSDTCTGRCYTSLSLQDLYIGSNLMTHVSKVAATHSRSYLSKKCITCMCVKNCFIFLRSKSLSPFLVCKVYSQAFLIKKRAQWRNICRGFIEFWLWGL